MSDSAASPLAEALARVGDRWTLLLVEALLPGPRRFGELRDGVDGIAPNVLSQRLKQLERDGIVVARPYSTRPLRNAYELSMRGRDLGSALRLLAQWGASGQDADPPRHSTCGTPMEARWWCPTCAREVDEREHADVRFV